MADRGGEGTPAAVSSSRREVLNCAMLDELDHSSGSRDNAVVQWSSERMQLPLMKLGLDLLDVVRFVDGLNQRLVDAVPPRMAAEPAVIMSTNTNVMSGTRWPHGYMALTMLVASHMAPTVLHETRDPCSLDELAATRHANCSRLGVTLRKLRVLGWAHQHGTKLAANKHALASARQPLLHLRGGGPVNDSLGTAEV